MGTMFSKSVTVRPSLEQLESRDMPSSLGAALPLVTQQFLVGKSLNSSNYWTSNLQHDFNALQSDLVHLGPTNPTTVADLSRTMSDYGFAEQTYAVGISAAGLFKDGVLFGLASGALDQSDIAPILISFREVQSMLGTINSQENTAHIIAHTPFAGGITLGGQHVIADLSRPMN